MPVLFDSSAWNTQLLSSGAGSVSVGHRVSPLATNTFGIVGALWLGNVASTSGTIAVTFGGDAMTGSTPIRWGTSSKNMFRAFTVPSVAGGAQEVTASVAAMGGAGVLVLASLSLSGVGAMGTIVLADGTTTTANAVTAPSVAAAYRVVSLHACGDLLAADYFTAFSGTKRADAISTSWPFTLGELIIGDTPGATSVTATATQASSTNNWGAFAIPLSPAIVEGDASLNISMTESANGGIYRVAAPSPGRTWVIEN